MTTTTLAKTDGRLHAVQDGRTLCGADIAQVVPTGNQTPVGIWAVLNAFSGRCEACSARLVPAVALVTRPVVNYRWASENFRDRDIMDMAAFVGDHSYDNSEATKAHVVRVVKAALAAGWGA